MMQVCQLCRMQTQPQHEQVFSSEGALLRLCVLNINKVPRELITSGMPTWSATTLGKALKKSPIKRSGSICSISSIKGWQVPGSVIPVILIFSFLSSPFPIPLISSFLVVLHGKRSVLLRSISLAQLRSFSLAYSIVIKVQSWPLSSRTLASQSIGTQCPISPIESKTSFIFLDRS